jgi:hypothetical protein
MLKIPKYLLFSPRKILFLSTIFYIYGFLDPIFVLSSLITRLTIKKNVLQVIINKLAASDH